MKIEDRIEAAEVILRDSCVYEVAELQDRSKVGVKMINRNIIAQSIIKAAGIDELLEDNRKMRELLEYGLRYASLDFPMLTSMPPIYTKNVFCDKAKQILAQTGN